MRTALTHTDRQPQARQPAVSRLLSQRSRLAHCRILLEHAGYKVACEATAKEALALSEQGDFDLLISDIGMPDLNGYQMLAELRRRPRTATLPAIVLTGYGRSEDAQRALAAGFQAHVVKPVDIEHFQSVMAAVVACARAR